MVPTCAVTGALGYTGRALAERLIASGWRVRTLTNSPSRPNPFGPKLEIHPLAWEDPAALARSLDGCDVLFNTYWVRFNHRLFTFEEAVRNTRVLFEAAVRAGVGRIVHVSILNADRADDLGYYAGKHELEGSLRALGVPHAIVRPGVLFGRFDVLVNNIAWAVRRFPVVGLFDGGSSYALRPLHVDDMAALMQRASTEPGNIVIDAVGPERYTFRELVEQVAGAIGVRRPIISVPGWLGHAVLRAVGPLVGDVILTREEISGLTRNLLDSEAPAAGGTRLSEWMIEHRGTLGVRYASEIGRRTQRAVEYAAVK